MMLLWQCHVCGVCLWTHPVFGRPVGSCLTCSRVKHNSSVCGRWHLVIRSQRRAYYYRPTRRGDAARGTP